MKAVDGEASHLKWTMAVHDDGTVSMGVILERKDLTPDRQKRIWQVSTVEESVGLYVNCMGQMARLHFEFRVWAELTERQVECLRQEVAVLNIPSKNAGERLIKKEDG